VLGGTGLFALVDLVSNMKLPNFAKWRWGTLDGVCRHLEKGGLESLRLSFDPAPFRKAKDQSQLNKVVEALQSEQWNVEFKFVSWFSNWLGAILAWVGCCLCHREDYEAGIAVECTQKGRLLSVAYEYADGKLQAGLAIAHAWKPHMFGGNATFVAELQGCVRYVVATAYIKLDFLDRIPVLCARLRQPGVRDRCLAAHLYFLVFSLVLFVRGASAPHPLRLIN
jgi:hypothetical protein